MCDVRAESCVQIKKICSGITRAKNSGGEGGHLSPNLSPDSKLNYLCIDDGRRS